MCSMALVHSRINRLYFLNYNEIDGGITSKGVEMNHFKNLNHKYLAFKLGLGVQIQEIQEK